MRLLRNSRQSGIRGTGGSLSAQINISLAGIRVDQSAVLLSTLQPEEIEPLSSSRAKGGSRATRPGGVEWRADSDSFLAEQALLIHPELDEPGDHLVFHPNGDIEPKNGSVKGEETRNICDLNREKLRIARKKVVDRMLHELKKAVADLWHQRHENPQLTPEALRTAMDNCFHNALLKIHQAQELHKPYSRLGWHLTAEFDRFFLDQLPKSNQQPDPNRTIIKMAFSRFSP